MNNSLITGVLAALTLSSCSVTQRTHTVSSVPVETQVYNVTVADLDVKEEKATSTTDWKWNLFSTFSLSKVKKDAEAQLLNATSADVIVEPQYIVERRGVLRGGSVTVSGYPARYTNFHTITDTEATALVSKDTISVKNKPVITLSRLHISGPALTPIVKSSIKLSSNIPSRSFINLIGGTSIYADNDYLGYSAGLMYGHHGKSLGWYVKGTYAYNDDYCEVKDYSLTAGIIKPFTRALSVFAGAGVGYFSESDYDYYWESYTEECISIPFDLGAQFTIKKFNILVGCSYTLNTTYPDYWHIRPFVGVGLSF